MGDFLHSLLQNKKSLASILILGILILGIPIGMKLVEYQKTLRSRAAGEPIEFVESDTVYKQDNKWFTKTKTISFKINSPLGDPAPAQTTAPTTSPTQAPTTTAPTQAPTTSPTQAPTSAPSAATGLTYSCSSDNTKVNLSWNTVSGATGYILRLNRIDGPGADWNNPVGDINNPADRYISASQAAVNNLKVDAGKDYDWTIQVIGRSDQNHGSKFKCGSIAATHHTTLTLSKNSGFVNGETITLNFTATGGTVKVIHTSVWEGITDPSQKTGGGNYQGFSGSIGQRQAKVPFYVEWLARGSLADEPTQNLLVKP